MLPWLLGRDVIVLNSDAFFPQPLDLGDFVATWDRTRPRLLVVPDSQAPDFDGRWRFAGTSLLPAVIAGTLRPEPAGLYETVWSKTEVDLVPTAVEAIDCGTPAAYLRANLVASGGRSVVGAGADVRGSIERTVVWPGAVVHEGEHLVDVIRARDPDGSDVTVAAAG